MIQEGLAKIYSDNVFLRGPGKISNGFYNFEMIPSRDLTVSLLKIIGNGIALDGMAGTGIRGIRIALESGWKVILNDKNQSNQLIIKRNLELNGLDLETWSIDFNEAVAKRYWDYIDLDPYGSPVGYIENSLKHLKNNGILGVTMTDTSTLEGNSLQKGFMKYGGIGLRGIYSKEISTRIFLGYIIRIASSLELGSEVLLVLREKHYIRLFLRFKKGVTKALNSLKNVNTVIIEGNQIGPMYLGKLYSNEIINAIKLENATKRTKNLYENMKNEDLMFLFFPNRYDKKEISVNKIINSLSEIGFAAGRTNFYDKGIKTDAKFEVFYQILKSLA